MFRNKLHYSFAVFLFTLSVSILFQKVVLPKFLPHMDAGNGLIQGTDSIFHHKRALNEVENIRKNGWGSASWGDLKDHRFIVGQIVGTLYALTVPDPIVMLPLNAIIHALSAVLLLSILQICFGPQSKLWLATLPFVLFPSASSWYAQILRDGYAIFGFYLVLFACLRLFENANQNAIKDCLYTVVLGAVGCLLLASFRPFLLVLLRYLLPIGLPILLLWDRNRSRIAYKSIQVICLILLPFAFIGNEYASRISVDNTPGIAEGYEWNSSALPGAVDKSLRALAVVRKNFVDVHQEAHRRYGTSQIDEEVLFHSAWDILKYIPRALQIGLFSPFPNEWFTNMNLIIGGIETLIVYFSLLIFAFRSPPVIQRPKVLFSLFLSLSFISFFSMTFNNIGGVYRYRYGFLMVLVGIAFSSALSFQRASSNWSRRRPNLRTDSMNEVSAPA